MKQFKLHCDGGARPMNPGNGYGSYEIESMCRIVGDRFYKRGHYEMEFGSDMTNNEAEYGALIVGLKTLLNDATTGWLSEHLTPGGITLCCYSDSKLMVEQLTGNWKVRNPGIKDLHAQAKEVLGQFGHWNIKWNSRTFNVARFGH